MTYRYLMPLLLSGFLLQSSSNTAHAQDGFFMSSQSVGKGQWAVGAQPVLLTQSNDGMLMLRGAYGMDGNVTLHGKLGVFEDETYAGGHFEFGMFSESRSLISITLLGGVHVWEEPGLKISGIAGKRLGQARLFSGISYEPIFFDGNTLNPLLIPIGIEVHLAESPAIIALETDLAANKDGEFLQAVTGGIYLRL